MMNSRIEKLGRRVLAGGTPLGIHEALDLATEAAKAPFELFFWADQVRRAHFGPTIRLCCIVAGKLGACAEDCRWCAQSIRWARNGENAPQAPCRGLTKPQVADKDEILSAARKAAAAGADCIGIVNSGRRPATADLSAVSTAVKDILSSPDNIAVCASLGEITDVQARQLAVAGVHRYHHNLETSRRMFPLMVTTHTFDDRLRTIAAARKAGMSICCGGIFGLGETWEDRVDLAFTLREEVRPDVVPINFLHPIPGTPLEKVPPTTPLELLSILSIYRLILPKADIKVAGGRLMNLRQLQSWVFFAGASSCMVGNFLTTTGQSLEEDLQMIRDLGLVVNNNPSSNA